MTDHSVAPLNEVAAAPDPSLQQHASRLADEAVAAGRELRLEELIEHAQALGPDPALADLDDERLVRSFVVQSAQLAAASARWLALLAELVVRDIWADQGARTPGQWLSWKVGLAPSTAREQVRVALRLRELPLIRARFEAGELSYSKVRALTRIAVPGLEELGLQLAAHATGAQLERMAGAVVNSRRAGASSEEDRQRRRGISWRHERDGDVTLQLRMSAEDADSVLVLLERLVTLELDAREATELRDDERADGRDQPEPGQGPQPPGDVSDPAGDGHTTDVRGAGEDADPSWLAGGGLPDGAVLDAGETSGAQRSRRDFDAHVVEVLLAVLGQAVADGPPDTTGQDRHTLVVHVDAEHLADEHGRVAGADLPVPVGRARVPAMRVRVLRRLACEAGLVLIATRNGSPMDVGRRQRRLTVALRRAVLARDRGCRFPGCGATRHLHVHHVWHWADGGPTDLANLVTLCGAHHRFVHERAWTVTPASRPGRFRFAPPGGQPLAQGPVTIDLDTADQADRLPPPPAVGRDPLIPHNWSADDTLDLTSAIIAFDQELRTRRPDLTIAA